MTIQTEPSAAATAERSTSPVDGYVCCPECDGPSIVEWRATLGGTDGPVEHVKIRCGSGHWFLMPAAGLAPYLIG
jgi:hypothetical protein